MNKVLFFLKDLINPITNPEVLVVKYWQHPFRYITGNQLGQIVRIILKEVETSRYEYGLFIDEEDIEFEILFWLTVINECYGVFSMKEADRDMILSTVTRLMDENFKKISKKYFERISSSKHRQVNSNNAYRVHIECVRAAILNAVYNDEIKL